MQKFKCPTPETKNMTSKKSQEVLGKLAILFFAQDTKKTSGGYKSSLPIWIKQPWKKNLFDSSPIFSSDEQLYIFDRSLPISLPP